MAAFMIGSGPSDGHELRVGSAEAAANRKKHGVSFEEALTVFGDRLARIFDDRTIPERTLERSSWDIPRDSGFSSSASSSGAREFGSSARGRQHGGSGRTMKTGRARSRIKVGARCDGSIDLTT